jgi:hypothetical protein
MGRRRTAARPIRSAEVELGEGESPLFEDVTDLSYISVSREDPEEGYVGRITPAATEKDIAKKWGGGTFALRPCNAGGKYVKGLGTRTIQIAGDPIFQSPAAEAKWKRSQGLATSEPARPATAAADRALGFGELMVILDKQAERAREAAQESADRRAKEQEAAHARQLELIREESRRREKELEVERARLAQESAERTARLDRELTAERERQREHMQTMLQLVKQKSEAAADSTPLATLMAGIKLATEMGQGGGGKTDPLSLLAENLPEVIAEARKLATADKSNPEAPAAAAGSEGSVTLEGSVGEKARRLVEHLQRQGRDPEAVLSKVFDTLAQTRPGAPSVKTPAPPAAPRAGAAPRPAPARAAARRPTSRPPKSRGGRRGATR